MQKDAVQTPTQDKMMHERSSRVPPHARKSPAVFTPNLNMGSYGEFAEILEYLQNYQISRKNKEMRIYSAKNLLSEKSTSE